MANGYDLIVLGSGPGGYVAAIRAAQLGLKTAIVERENLGGICLNWGCIPTKALLRSAEVFHNMKHAADYGLAAEKISADLDAIVKRSRGVAKQLNQGVTGLMKKNKIDVHMGDGRLTAKDKIVVTGESGETELTAGSAFCQGRRQAHLDLSPRDDAKRNADQVAGHWFWRDRHRVCQLL